MDEESVWTFRAEGQLEEQQLSFKRDLRTTQTSNRRHPEKNNLSTFNA